ncbi:hypothetical protein SAMD00019534_001640 [Acytostelium subglobosum LB1]|uniref:hypothetical protein n=1 Tax=Acytostelium subglobosum LB1 TaxID=1410327 RepID=UPI000644DE81|nr:hypothetical protein SAMD00019534_001640 [Acytostelium subglobosum LB1]GAM16989.1 hypothetical protein SAMD00019534_001640 [Acytostelium subglobosum LB1]|eukprot:XP_012759051.1 hypothetical protein SAMD00019534_001640 [Acytostelium subglobosum LB1]
MIIPVGYTIPVSTLETEALGCDQRVWQHCNRSVKMGTEVHGCGQLGSMASHLSSWLSVWLESEVVDGGHHGSMEAVSMTVVSSEAGGSQRGS